MLYYKKMVERWNNMITFVESIGINVISNIVYDIAKNIIIKLKRSPEKSLQNTVQEIFENGLEYAAILDSSNFYKYFDSPQFLDLINAYLEHKIICDFANANAEIKKYIKKSDIISQKEIIEYISKNIEQMNIYNDVETKPAYNEIKKAVLFVLSAIEQTILRNLSSEDKELAYFIGSRMDYHYQRIEGILQKHQDLIAATLQTKLLPSYDDHENIKNDYYSILKEKYSSAHIYLLDKFPFESFYVPPILLHQENENNLYKNYDFSLVSWNDIFERNNIVYIIGGAGYGKSLFTQKIINNYTDLNILHSDEYLVIYGELKSFYPNSYGSPLSVVEFLKNSIRSSALVDVSDEFIKYYLNLGRCIVLLDALDEVDKSRRSELHEKIVAYFKSQNPNNKVCITSRDRGFIPEQNIEVLKICPLNNEQIEKYVNKIIALGKFEKSDKDSFMAQTRILVDKGFLNSFLVLSLLINIYKAERELPENKLDLYQKCFEYIANKREKEKITTSFNWDVISPIMKDNTFIELAKLCMPNNSNVDKLDIINRLVEVYKTKYGCEADAENAVDEFLKFCSERTELFVPSAEDKFKFFHRSFFEYFYSSYIFLRCGNTETMLSEFVKFDVDSEVFELTVAMLKQKDEIKYQALIDLLFEKSKSNFANDSNDYMAFNILILSMQVIDDVIYKIELLDIIVAYKEKILRDISYIHNLRLLDSIFKNDLEACNRISDAYKDEALMIILNNCENFAYFFDEFSNEQDKLLKELHPKDFSVMIRRRFAFRHIDDDNYFYYKFFIKLYNTESLLNKISSETVLSVYKKFSKNNYKKRAENFQNALVKINQMPSAYQDTIWKLIASNKFIMYYRKR